MIRIHNAGEIMRAIHVDGPITRSALVDLTGLNRSTVGTHVQELDRAGLVLEDDGRAGNVGRPSRVVSAVAVGAVVVACDVRVDHISMAIIGLGGEILARADVDHDRSDVSVARICQVIADRAHILLQECGVPAARVCGIGVALPGLVDRHVGTLRYAPNLDWFDVPFAATLASKLAGGLLAGKFIALRNDADAGALAERTRGAARNVASAVYLSGGVGIGAGIVLSGKRIVDAGGFSGEIGHMIVNPQGRVCDCGERGCWETEISADRLTSAAARVEVLEWLELGLRNLVNVLNPDVVVLGDHLRQFTDELADRQHRSYRLAAWDQVEFRPARLGADSTLIGAAEAAFDPFLSSPLEYR